MYPKNTKKTIPGDISQKINYFRGAYLLYEAANVELQDDQAPVHARHTAVLVPRPQLLRLQKRHGRMPLRVALQVLCRCAQGCCAR